MTFHRRVFTCVLLGLIVYSFTLFVLRGGFESECCPTPIFAESPTVAKLDERFVERIRQAAERNDPEEGGAVWQFALGDIYYRGGGVGVSQDRTEAVKWFRKAAEQGLEQAQIALAECYIRGHGVPKNEAEAINWLRKAEEQGNLRATAYLREIEIEGNN